MTTLAALATTSATASTASRGAVLTWTDVGARASASATAALTRVALLAVPARPAGDSRDAQRSWLRSCDPSVAIAASLPGTAVPTV